MKSILQILRFPNFSVIANNKFTWQCWSSRKGLGNEGLGDMRRVDRMYLYGRRDTMSAQVRAGKFLVVLEDFSFCLIAGGD